MYERRFQTKEQVDQFLSEIHNPFAGLDEVGRGVLAGAVVVACVVLPPSHGIEGIADSKKLSKKKRQSLYDQLVSVCDYGIGVVENDVVDSINIRQATHKAAFEAIDECIAKCPELKHVLCDGNLFLKDKCPVPVNSIVKGDNWIESISAASIIAKVYRDNLMSVYHTLWPEYNFLSNSGYGTAEHLEAIEKYGITPIHRRSFGRCRTARARQ